MIELNKMGTSRIHSAFLEKAGLPRLSPDDGWKLVAERVNSLTFQFFGEHCTECGAPDCHSTCDVFERGPAGRCRRFVDGIVMTRRRGAPYAASTEALVKPWGRLLAIGNMFFVSPTAYRTCMPVILGLSRLLYLIQHSFCFLPGRLQWKICDKIQAAGNMLPRFLNKIAGKNGHGTSLLVVIGNPRPQPMPLEIVVSGFGDSQGGRIFRKVVSLSSGWTAIEAPLAEIRHTIDTAKLFRVCIVPMIDEPAMIQLVYAGFADMKPLVSKADTRVSVARDDSSKKSKSVKLLVFDVDNTLWDGILIEESDRDFQLRPQVRETLVELDKRGILLSIASRNNHADIRDALTKLGIWDLFLFPAVNWGPKSESIRQIVDNLNIGMDTVGFVDDSKFEREEVRSALPEVRTYDSDSIATILRMPEFDVPVTDESAGRRMMYRQETQRKSAFSDVGGSYDEFLRSCEMRATLLALDNTNMQRVAELAQRTNQLNFSGRHYSREQIASLATEAEVLPVAVKCGDRFGDYGIVGFAILGVTDNTVEISDMMFSCRVQGKKIEHAFILYTAGAAKRAGIAGCVCFFTPTARNSHAQKVFDELSCRLTHPTGGDDNACAYAIQDSGMAFSTVPVEINDQVNLAAGLERCLRRRQD